jgi:hypothetical protein
MFSNNTNNKAPQLGNQAIQPSIESLQTERSYQQKPLSKEEIKQRRKQVAVKLLKKVMNGKMRGYVE